MSETELKPCPCMHTKPCDPRCTCVDPFSSVGCGRCCSYGSREQQRATAEYLAGRIDGAPDPRLSALESRVKELEAALAEARKMPECVRMAIDELEAHCGCDAGFACGVHRYVNAVESHYAQSADKAGEGEPHD